MIKNEQTTFAKDTHLQEEVGDAFVPTTRSQHQWRLPLRGRHIDVHPSLKQHVHDGVVADVRSVHQRSPATAVPLIEVQLPAERHRTS